MIGKFYMNKNLVSKSLSLLVLPLLIGCGGSSDPTSSVVSETDNSSVTKMGGVLKSFQMVKRCPSSPNKQQVMVTTI